MRKPRPRPTAPLLVRVPGLLLTTATAGALQLSRTDEAIIADTRTALTAPTSTCRALVRMANHDGILSGMTRGR